MTETTPSAGAGAADDRTTARLDVTDVDTTGPGNEPPAGRRRPVTLIVALVVAVAVIIALVAALVWSGDDNDQSSTGPGTTEEPTTEPPTTEPATTEPTTATTAVPPTPDTFTAVFPDGAGSVRFDDPVEAARGFAVDFVGFTDPVVGEFMAGDARSGEVEVRPVSNGPVTTVLVRQLGPDDSWWVLGSATGNITVDTPTAGEAITSPVTVTGEALAFEGQVNVEVRQDGAREPIGTGYVMGGGGPAAPFSGEIEFSTPTADYGALVFLSLSAENGAVWEASVLRVSFD